MGNLYDIEAIRNFISEGKRLLLAGDEALLTQLPKGNWIGGTIPYFMGEKGGISTNNQIYANILPDYVISGEIKTYSQQNIQSVFQEAPQNGFTIIIIPASSPTHLDFAMNSPHYPNFALAPTIGWISGVHLDDLGKITPKIFNGTTQNIAEDGAVVMHCSLPAKKFADVHIFNIFEQGQGDLIEFPATGFATKMAFINGEERNFAEYIQEQNLNIKLPLVADYCGANINISFQNVDPVSKEVTFYAPIFKGVQYRQAKPLSNYVTAFEQILPKNNLSTIGFSCNCILNYLYGELEGKQTGGITGPITFGEIAYQLVNQTMTILTIDDL